MALATFPPGGHAEPTAAAAASLAEQVLAQAQAGREVVQEFVPLAESLEWELGQEYLRQRGNKAADAGARDQDFGRLRHAICPDLPAADQEIVGELTARDLHRNFTFAAKFEDFRA